MRQVFRTSGTAQCRCGGTVPATAKGKNQRRRGAPPASVRQLRDGVPQAPLVFKRPEFRELREHQLGNGRVAYEPLATFPREGK